MFLNSLGSLRSQEQKKTRFHVLKFRSILLTVTLIGSLGTMKSHAIDTPPSQPPAFQQPDDIDPIEPPTDPHNLFQEDMPSSDDFVGTSAESPVIDLNQDKPMMDEALTDQLAPEEDDLEKQLESALANLAAASKALLDWDKAFQDKADDAQKGLDLVNDQIGKLPAAFTQQTVNVMYDIKNKGTKIYNEINGTVKDREALRAKLHEVNNCYIGLFNQLSNRDKRMKWRDSWWACGAGDAFKSWNNLDPYKRLDTLYNTILGLKVRLRMVDIIQDS